MKGSKGWAFLLSVAFAVVGACGGQTVVADGGETNWLKDCSATGQCSVGECVCGICTARCTQNDECVKDEPAICVTPGGLVFEALCEAETSAPKGVCVRSCESDAECGETMQCAEGVCVAGVPVSTARFSDTIMLPSEDPSALRGRCLAPLTGSGDVAPNCSVLFVPEGCNCDGSDRVPATERELAWARRLLAEQGRCGQPDQPDCGDTCVCKLLPASGDAESQCQNDLEASFGGWCYVDPAHGVGDEALVELCPPTEQQLLRLGSGTPDAGPYFISCAATELASRDSAGPPRGIGEVCVPPQEYSVVFAGFDAWRVDVTRGTDACESGVCLVHNFQGRVTCPFGNETEDCLTPDGRLVEPSLPVYPQYIERRPDDAVLCSCRCDGPDDSAEYCTCPAGFTCQEVLPEWGLPGEEDYAGSYCIRNGTFVAADPSQIPSQQCSREAGNCE